MTEYGAADLNLGITEKLAGYLATLDYDDLSDDAAHECRRGILDWLGCALAGSAHETIDTLTGVLAKISPAGNSTVIGRKMKLGLLEAAIANGQMGHVLDYDDTHLGGGGVHTSGPLMASLLPLAEARGIDGKTFIAAYAAGFEAATRTGMGMPAHHDGGWHLTGTIGTVGAGAACARLLGLDGEQMVHAFGIAATQSGGMQQNRGTMCKSLHPGKAASNGLLAGMLAEGGFDSSGEILEGKKGFCRIFSTVTDEDAILSGLGDSFAITDNGYKPYACGVVLHPVLDTTIHLGKESGIAPDDVATLEITAHPKAVSITGVQNPQSGLKSKFSITHASAVSYIDGTAGRGQFSTDRALAPEVVALREKVTVQTDENLRLDQAIGTVTAKDGKTATHTTEHATGMIDNPMSDDQIVAKFLDNAAPAVGEETAAEIKEMVWELEKADNLVKLMKLLG
ncbi:MAG TPA: 2-methylcitrate dehydratase [Rhodospirillaceae bacterium]|nr:2-methylcitrate dehydratase [Rhodospirillaceae bacterium]